VGEEGTIIKQTLSGSYKFLTMSQPCLLRSITYGNNQFVAVGEGKILLYLPKTETTITPTPPKTIYLRGVVYGMDTTTRTELYIAVGDGRSCLISNDGMTWSAQSLGILIINMFGIAYGNGVFVAVGNAGLMNTSTNGTYWTKPTSGVTSCLNNIAYGDGVFVALGR
jgi:hypothetical protein